MNPRRNSHHYSTLPKSTILANISSITSQPNTELPLTDFQFFEALECGLRLHFDRRVEKPTIVTQPDLKSALYRRLLHLFVQQKRVEEIQLNTAKLWLEGTTPGACFDYPVETQKYSTHIPLLYRDTSAELFIVYFQGRRWSKKERSFHPSDLERPKVKRTLQKLALQESEFLHHFPDLTIRSLLLFPNSSYRKDPDQTLEDIFHTPQSNLKSEALQDLFAEVEVTEWVQKEKETLHHLWDQVYSGLSYDREFQPGKKCFHCRYRKGRTSGGEGCWELKTQLAGIRNPNLHTPDLPGHGNTSLVESGVLFQEQVNEDSYESPTQLNLQWRRARQIEIAREDAKELQDPHQREFIHPKLKERIEDLAFPIHCIDFEAASFPISPGFPRKPYVPVIFQFSCHSIYSKQDLEEGKFQHVQWIDTEFSDDPEIELIHQLSQIDQIEKGTFFHYAPFEKQHLHKLYSRASQESHQEWQALKAPLQRLLHSSDRNPRFMDMADWVGRYYFHERMEGGLGLKNLHQALLFEENYDDLRIDRSIAITDQVKNGEHAMHIYLGLRTGALDLSEKEQWAKRLLEYCAMDTRVMARAIMYWSKKL